MRKDPYIIAWKLSPASVRELQKLQKFLKTQTSPDSVLLDRIVTMVHNQETMREEKHRFGDYFDRVCLLPATNGESRSTRLFFQRKSHSERFWKDLMASVITEAGQICGSSEVL